jgi:hypothetical protein
MIDDPIVREIRQIRHEIDQEHHKDPEQYLEHLRLFQKNMPNDWFVASPSLC